MVKESELLQIANSKIWNWTGEGSRELGKVIPAMAGLDNTCIWLNYYLIHYDSVYLQKGCIKENGKKN